MIKWSKDGEYFNHDTLSEMINDFDLKLGDVVYYGEAEFPSAPLMDAEDIIEDAQNRAMDYYGEHASCYLDDITDEATKELNDFLQEWKQNHCAVNFWMVDKVIPHTINDNNINNHVAWLAISGG